MSRRSTWRLAAPLFFAGIFLAAVSWAEDEVKILPGLVTANNVDVTADDGSLLPDRLNVGDTLYVIGNPKKKRAGWERVTRSPEDTSGIGWIESKNIRTFSRYEAPEGEKKPSREEVAGEKTVFAPDVEKAKYSKVGIIPFVTAEMDDPVGATAYELFTMQIKKRGIFQVTSSPALSAEKVDPEAADGVHKVMERHNLDGLFVGKVSANVGGNRLLDVKFYGKDRQGFILDKVTRLPEQGNLLTVVDRLVTSIVDVLK